MNLDLEVCLRLADELEKERICGPRLDFSRLRIFTHSITVSGFNEDTIAEQYLGSDLSNEYCYAFEV